MRSRRESDNPYVDAGGKPRLLPSIVALIDILGYQGMIRDATKRESGSLDLPTKLQATVSGAVSHLRQKTPGPFFWMTKTFTDNFVLGYPIDPHRGETNPGDSCRRKELALRIIAGRVAAFQMEMTRGGFFVRGAIAVGDMHVDEDVVYGPALLCAHDAEQEIARDPRVILTDSALGVIGAEQQRPAVPRHSRHEEPILEGCDGKQFVNYLASVLDGSRSSVGCRQRRGRAPTSGRSRRVRTCQLPTHAVGRVAKTATSLCRRVNHLV